MATTDILPFAIGVSADVQSQADYAAASSTANGFAAGIAEPDELNKVWRQASFMAAGLANWMAANGINVPDDGDINNLIDNMITAIASNVVLAGNNGSNFIGFIQDTVNARLRSLQDRGREIVYSNDFTGTATQRVQRAIDYVASSGGLVLLPRGPITLGDIAIPATVGVRGQGQIGTFVTYSGAANFALLGGNADTLYYGCELSEMHIYTESDTATLVNAQGTCGALIRKLYLEGPINNTRSTVGVVIDGKNASGFFNRVEDVICNHIHKGYVIQSTGTVPNSTYPTEQYLTNCTSLGDVGTDATSIGIELGQYSGNGTVIIGGNLEGTGTAIHLTNQCGSAIWNGVRLEGNTNDITLDGFSSAQTFFGLINLNAAKVHDNSGTGYERHTFVGCISETGANYGDSCPGSSTFRAATITDVALIAKGFPGQTGHIFEAQNSAGAVGAYITPAGAAGFTGATILSTGGSLMAVGKTTTPNSCHTIASAAGTEGTRILDVFNAADGCTFYEVATGGANAAAAAMRAGKNSSTSRSINAAGTFNASGTDYAEYMIKSAKCGTIEKGQIIGIDGNGQITDQFESAVAFAIKSTNPSYVGGDTWASPDVIGEQPVQPIFTMPEYSGVAFPGNTPRRMKDEDDESYAKSVDDYEKALIQFESDKKSYEGSLVIEKTKFDKGPFADFVKANDEYIDRHNKARATVDRIAFSGRVPCNVKGAKPGDYIVAEKDGKKIKGTPVAQDSITFDQYKRAVGLVVDILEDGRPLVIVKIS